VSPGVNNPPKLKGKPGKPYTLRKTRGKKKKKGRNKSQVLGVTQKKKTAKKNGFWEMQGEKERVQKTVKVM